MAKKIEVHAAVTHYTDGKAVLVLIASLAFMALGIWIVSTIGPNTSGWLKADSIIYSIYGKEVTVEFFANGVKYHSTLNEYNSTWNVGDHLPILYNPANPKAVVWDQPNWIKAIIYGFLALFGAVGVTIFTTHFVRKYLRNKKMAAASAPQIIIPDMPEIPDMPTLPNDEEEKK